MLKNLLFLVICFFALCGVMVQADLTEILSFGAPPSSTGAPGEISCAESGCHDDGPIPQSHQSHLLSIETRNGTFIPGDTALITVQVQDPEVQRFGFQLTAINESGKAIGEFLITDSLYTQIMHNHVDLTDREYVTYTKAGTLASQTGKHSWTFKWIIPQTQSSFARFYLATVSANNDNRDKGDNVFLRDTTISLQKANSVLDNKEISIEQKGKYLIVHQESNPKPIKVYTILGDIHREYPGNHGQLSIDLTDFPIGLYVLKTGNIIHSFIP
jgi:hypothetical protein